MAAALDPTPVAAAIYTRISSDDDKKVKELGVARQRKECLAVVERNGWALLDTYVDNNVSASKDGVTRPQYLRLMKDIGAGRVDRVVVLGQDRLVRKPDELEDVIRSFRRAGIPGIDTPSGNVDLSSMTGRSMARVQGVFNIQYAEFIGEKVRLKHAELAERGLPSGGPRPFGYDIDRMTVRPDEAALIREAAERVLRGERCHSICVDWNRRGHTTAQGAQWRAETLKPTLTRPRVAGLRQHHGVVVGEAAWPAILDRDTWRAVTAVLGVTARRGPTERHLLSGTLICGLCGEPLAAAKGCYANGGRYDKYSCLKRPGQRNCGRLAIQAERLEAFIVEAVLVASDTDMLRVAKRPSKKATEDVGPLRARLDDLMAAYGAGIIRSARELAAARKPLDEAIERAEASESATALDVARSATLFAQRKGVLRQRWPHLTPEQKRQEIRAALECVRVLPATRKGRGSWDPDRLKLQFRR